jgi:hypothetical protein
MAGSGPTREELARLLGALTQRVFLMRNVHDDAPVLLKSRWALSYLRGPLTPGEISRLMAPRKQTLAEPAAAPVTNGQSPASAPPVAQSDTRESPPADVEEAFVAVRGGTEGIIYRPQALGRAKLHFVDKSAGVDTWQTLTLIAPFADDGQSVLWNEAAAVTAEPARDPVAGASFAALPASALRAASYATWGKALAAQLYQELRLPLFACDALKQVSAPDESEGDFRARLQLAVREKRDAQVEKLRQKYAPKLATLQAQKQRAVQRIERERGQASQQKLQTAISVGATILGAFLGRKAVSSTSVGRATTAARSASRIGREAQDVARAEDSAEAIDQRLADLNKELEAAIAALDTSLDAQHIELREIRIAPRKSDIAIGMIQLLWTPWRNGADGFPVEAS